MECARNGKLTPVLINLPAAAKEHPRSARVDHIMPKAHGGTDDPNNLETLCNTCHKAKTARETTEAI